MAGARGAEACIVIEGGHPLRGVVRIDTAKNAILPALAAAVLAEDELVLHRVPALDDVRVMCQLLRHIGLAPQHRGTSLHIRWQQDARPEAPYELTRRLRASFVLSGALLARFGRASIALPGGCAIGSRPVDIHLKGLRAMGARVEDRNGCLEFSARRLHGATVYLDLPSVTATENLMMAAALAEGETILENAAAEPEVVDLANLLNAMGGRVSGAGTARLRIQGVRRLAGARYTCIPDRVEAGTYLIAAAATGGRVRLVHCVPLHLGALLAKLREAGYRVHSDGLAIEIEPGREVRAVNIKTLPYPGFPTDLQAPFMALQALLPGTSVVSETIFENRFLHVAELRRMGARIALNGSTALVEGGAGLSGCRVRATDLRAAAALVVAGLAARGTTVVEGLEHLDRGYAAMERKLSALGARVRRVAGLPERPGLAPGVAAELA